MSTIDPTQLDLDLNSSNTVTIDPSFYTSSITSPCSITWNSTASTCWPTYSGSTYSISSNITTPVVNIDSNGISLDKGTDIKIGDLKLSEVLTRLEERMNILHYNQELEGKWEELRTLGTQYRELEKELLEKEKMWKILKDKS